MDDRTREARGLILTAEWSERVKAPYYKANLDACPGWKLAEELLAEELAFAAKCRRRAAELLAGAELLPWEAVS